MWVILPSTNDKVWALATPAGSRSARGTDVVLMDFVSPKLWRTSHRFPTSQQSIIALNNAHMLQPGKYNYVIWKNSNLSNTPTPTFYQAPPLHVTFYWYDKTTLLKSRPLSRSCLYQWRDLTRNRSSQILYGIGSFFPKLKRIDFYVAQDWKYTSMEA